MKSKYVWSMDKTRKVPLSRIKDFLIRRNQDKFRVTGWLADSDFIVIGEYSTEEEAIAIIDELTEE